MDSTISATYARNHFFELIDLAVKEGRTFRVEKGGELAVEIKPAVSKKSPEEIRKVLKEVRKTFAKSRKRKYWSVTQTPAWRKKEAKYLKDLYKRVNP